MWQQSHCMQEKSTSEITVADVLRMIRQKQFINLAMSKAIKFLQDDVFIGESYDGEKIKQNRQKYVHGIKSFLIGGKVSHRH